MSGNEYYVGRISKLFGRVEQCLKESDLIKGDPLSIPGWDDAWCLTKNELVMHVVTLPIPNRPILLRFGSVYKAYWCRNDKWYQVGDTLQDTSIGKDLRWLKRYEVRNSVVFYAVLKEANRIDFTSLEEVYKSHRKLNLFGYHVQKGYRQLGSSQWRYKKLWPLYLKAIKKVNAILVDNNITINHSTISWGDLEVTNSTG